jgi:D-3-phosphoglycerate dehydrogenase
MLSYDRPNALVTLLISDTQLERLRSRCAVQLAGWGQTGNRLTEDELLALSRSAQFLIVGYEPVSARVIAANPDLRLIACGRGNPVNVDVAAATARGIPVLHTPGRNALAAAEFTLGLMINAARNITRGDRALRAGRYLGAERDEFTSADASTDITWNLDGESPYKQLCGMELNGRTLGLIGLGHVAAEVTRLAHAFGMRVVAHSFGNDRARAAELQITLTSLDDLLAQSDFISVHCRVSSESCGLLGREAFAAMKPGAYLINTARAAVIDQQALLDALRENRIAGAALDVFWYEPLPANHPLLSLENVILTPHLGGAAEEVAERHSRMIVDDIFAWMDGTKPRNVFNPAALP